MNTMDKIYIRRCFQLALKSAGYVSPNPLVGCVIVKEGKVISEGSHEKFGAPHAEINAINNASESVEGATLYCNLEPCCHVRKKTPPCVPELIKHKIKKVVISNTDPNPEVAGSGIEQLRQAGIEVEEGVLEEEGKYLNRFFFKYIRTGLPYVAMKIARSADGFISAKEGTQTWITGEEAAVYVHSLRARYDAVLVGANTINVDNPQLNVRHSEGRNPKRIIVDGNLSSNPDARVFNDGGKEGTIIFTKTGASAERLELFRSKGIKCFELHPSDEGNVPVYEMLKKLGEEKIASVFIEGGKQIFTQFINDPHLDEIILITSPKFLGDGVAPYEGAFPSNWRKIEENMLGSDQNQVFVRS